MAIERLVQGESAFRKAVSWVCALTLALSMAVPNASAFAAAADSDTGGETTEVLAAQGGEDQTSPDASLSEAALGGEQESGDAVEPEGDAAQAEPEALAAQPAAEEQDAPLYGTLAEGEAWDGKTIDVSWYNTTDTTFTITTAAQLAGLASITSPKDDYDAWAAGTHASRAEGIAQDNFKGKTVKLGADIDMSYNRMDPISEINNWGGGGQGTSNGTYDGVAWQGVLDGSGHVIKNIEIDGSANCSTNFGGYQGLISGIGVGGVVKNLGVTGSIYGRVAGGIVGCSNTESETTLTTSLTEWPLVENCWTDVNIKGNGSGSRGCGGIFGGESDRRAMCNVINCYALGDVNNSQAGGVTGSTNGIVAGCYNTGTVTGSYEAAIASTLYMQAATNDKFKAVGAYANNMALKGTSANVYRLSMTQNGNPTEVTDGFYTADQIKAGASTLGNGYVADANNANGGFPVLFWQAGEKAKDISGATIGAIEPQSYTGVAVEPDVTVKDGSTTLNRWTDYYVVYENNVNPGTNTAKVTAYGVGRYEGVTASVSFSITQLDLSACTIDPVGNTWSYGASDPAAPALTVKDADGNKLVQDVDYKVEYTNNVETGVATATIKPIGAGTVGEKSVSFNVVKASASVQGAGTLESPYLISSKGDLQFVSHQVRLGNEKYMSGEYKITADIDATAADEKDLAADPLGARYSVINPETGKSQTINNYFGGSIDGDGHTVTLGQDLSAGGTSGYGGFIAFAGFSSSYNNPTVVQTIKNLTIEGSVATRYAAGFIGSASGSLLKMENCTNKATIGAEGTSYSNGSMYAAGIIASAVGFDLVNCKNEGTIRSYYSSGYAAGIVAYRNTTSVTSQTSSYVDCSNSGDVTAPNEVAGIQAHDQNKSLVSYTRCYNTGSISSPDGSAGGITGAFDAYGGDSPVMLDMCYNTGTISAANYAGGLVGIPGYGELSITNSYNTGAVSTTATYASSGAAGGFVGGDRPNYSVKGNRTVSGYNAGAINGAVKGAFFGVQLANSRTFVTIYALDGGFLEQAGLDAIGDKTTSAACIVNDNTKAFADNGLKAVPSEIGSSFVKDEAPEVNGGFPALYWQKGVTAKDLSLATVSPIANQTYTGSALTPEVSVAIGSTQLKQNQDYTVAYSNNVNAGTATVELTGVGLYAGTLEATFVIDPQNVSAASIAEIAPVWASSAIPATPALTVSNAAGIAMVLGTDYTVAYSNNNATGTAQATITGAGNYTGTKTASFEVTATATSELEGAGTTADPYVINGKDDLEFVALAINNQVGTYPYAAYKLAGNIDATAADGRMAADRIGASTSAAFKGIFDGAGHTVTLGVDSSDNYVGLFGVVVDASIMNTTVEGSVSASRYVGGVVGMAAGNTSVTNCVNNANVKAIVQSAGGIVGALYASPANVKVSNCVNNGQVSTDGYVVGGIVGTSLVSGSTLEVTSSFNHGAITSVGNSNISAAGGIVGRVYNGQVSIVKCGNDASITGAMLAGGILGSIVSSQANQTSVLTDVYNTGSIQVTNAPRPTAWGDHGVAGGLIGSVGNSNAASSIVVKNAYNAGLILPDSNNYADLGGVVGGQTNTNAVITLTNVYFDKAQSVAVNYSKNDSKITDDTVAKTPEELKAVGEDGMAAQLGASFADDAANANGGFPVLVHAAQSAMSIAAIPVQTYAGAPVEPAVKVLDVSSTPAKQLSEGVDYLLVFEDNDAAGVASVTAVGLGSYEGQVAATTFEIAKGSLANCTVAEIPAQVATGSRITPELTVTTPSGIVLKEGVDFKAFFSDNVEIGNATYVLLGKGNYEGALVGTFKIVGKSIEDASVTMPDKVYYTGDALSVVPNRVAVDGDTLELGTDYEVAGYTDADGNDVAEVKDKGSYYVVLRGIGNYAGETKASFDVTTYLTVYAQKNGGDKVVAAELSEPQLAELAEEGMASSLYKGKSGWTVSTATSYVTLKNIFKAAGLEDAYAENMDAQVEFASGGFAVSETYANLEGGKFFPATTVDAIDESLTGDAVPASLALKEASSTIEAGKTAADAAEANAAAADGKNAPRVVVGATDEAYQAGSVAGRRLVSNVDSITISYKEPVIFKVMVQYADSSKSETIKEYTASDLWALASDGDPVSGMFWKGDIWRVVTAAEYVTFDDLFSDAGVGDLWTSGADLLWGGDDPNSPEKAAQSISYDTLMERCWFFPNASGALSDDPGTAIAAPPVLSLTEYSCATGEGETLTAADAQEYNVKNANTGNFPRTVWGISEDMYTTNQGDARGMYYWSNNSYLTIKTDQNNPNPDPGPEPEPSATVERVAGSSAVGTAAEIAKTAWAEGETSEWAVVARSDDFADAMSATGLAGALGAPIVLTSRDGLSDEAAATLERLGVSHAYIIGGEGAVSSAVDSALSDMGVASERIAGESRDATSVKCAEKIAELGGSSYAIVARSDSFRDALSMSSFAYKYHVPILLESVASDPADRVLSEQAQAMLIGDGAFGSARVFVPGGTAAVADSSLAFLGRSYERLSGENGYATSLAIANYLVDNGLLSADTVCVATGAMRSRGVDALAGAALAGRVGGVMLLVSAQPDYEAENYEAVDGFIEANADDISSVYVLGGTTPMPESVISRIEGELGISEE